MGKTLYLECKSGISGDMVVGALLDLGANESGLRRALASLNVDGFDIAVTRKQVSGIDACDFDVILDEEHDSHDHDMAYLYGDLDHAADGHHGHHHDHEGDHHHAHEHADDHDHAHDHEHTHDHDHDHDHDHSHDYAHHHHHHHSHRTPAEIGQIIDAADLAPRAKNYAHRIFDIVAQAEAKAHGLPLSEVHFHEVGAVDSIVDVVSVAYCLDDLDVTSAAVSPLAEGHGRVRCAHGVLSIPVPAVANIVADHGLVLERRDQEGELVTPTGAAIAAAVRTLNELPERYRIVKTGLGSGKRAYDPPSNVRAMIIEPAEDREPGPQVEGLGTPDLWKLETEVDDCTGEALGNVAQLLYDAGALEVHYLPVFMKKGRPGYQIEVLCGASHIAAIENLIFENTTTIGIRRCPEWRTALPRELREVETGLGTLKVKVVTLPSGVKRAYPEYESMAALSAESGLSYQDIQRMAFMAIEEVLGHEEADPEQEAEA